MALHVDHNLCIGCGACVAICPSGFEMNSEGKSDVIDPNAECGSKAVEACPVQAISI
jgi:ferredoxin